MRTFLIHVLVILIHAGIACTAFGQTYRADPSRIVEVKGPVDKKIIDRAKELEALSNVNLKPITIVINSPGGSVVPGFVFLNAMKLVRARGIKLNCVVTNLAASMAFHFLAECSERYAFDYSLLLWHPMRVGGMFASFSADEMEYLIYVMRAWELPLNARLMQVLNINKELFYYHYSKETLFTTIQLQQISPRFIRRIKNIQGVRGIF